MQVTLNLDTPEKKALFLRLFNDPAEVENMVTSTSVDFNLHKVVQDKLNKASDLRSTIDELVTFEMWYEVRESFTECEKSLKV